MFQYVPIFRAWAHGLMRFGVAGVANLQVSGFFLLNCWSERCPKSCLATARLCEVHRLILWPKHWPPLRPRQQDDHDGTLESLHIFVGWNMSHFFICFLWNEFWLAIPLRLRSERVMPWLRFEQAPKKCAFRAARSQSCSLCAIRSLSCCRAPSYYHGASGANNPLQMRPWPPTPQVQQSFRREEVCHLREKPQTNLYRHQLPEQLSRKGSRGAYCGRNVKATLAKTVIVCCSICPSVCLFVRASHPSIRPYIHLHAPQTSIYTIHG